MANQRTELNISPLLTVAHLVAGMGVAAANFGRQDVFAIHALVLQREIRAGNQQAQHFGRKVQGGEIFGRAAVGLRVVEGDEFGPGPTFKLHDSDTPCLFTLRRGHDLRVG
ncbi:hypothetical protein SDC9_169198 [bioreactor metagenome]|uniref:Uncharacterized protein n=1 Tax=bioreactor metagenome TaxID=1076179 RepID=A0A645G6N6_9ZZZZ